MEELKTFISLEDLAKLADEQYLKMLKENKIKDIVKAIGLFPDQTITNDILILTQNPNATLVKRLSDWGYYKRKVKEDQKGLKIISHVLKKYNIDKTDEYGNIYSQGVDKLDTEMGFVFDISQTEGKDYEYLNSNKENIAKHFEVVKKSLERTARDYKFEYTDIDTNSQIDLKNKIITIKDGLSIDEVINTLIDNVSTVLLATRRQEGLDNLGEFEQNAVIYAVKSKLGLDEPECKFDISNINDEGLVELKNNLQKVRSVTKQILSNVESSIEYAVRQIIKEEKAKTEELETEAPKEQPKPTKTTKTKTKQSQSEVE